MSKNAQAPRIVIIGLGYIAEYVLPGYQALLGDQTATHVIGVTLDESDIERKRRKLGFPVYLGDNAGALRDGKPDIIIFAPPPTAVPALMEDILLPYFQELRQAGQSLPDIYAFPPTPSGSAYQKMLGDDINVVNIIPNMFRTAGGVDISRAGFTLLSFPEGEQWGSESFARLSDFFAPFGMLNIQQPALLLDNLAGVIASYVIPDTIFAIADILFGGDEGAVHHLACILYGLQQGDPVVPKEGTEQKLRQMLDSVRRGIFDGTVRALAEKGVPLEEARANQAVTISQQFRVTALETRRTILYNTRKHATKGGITERGEIFLTQKIKPQLSLFFGAINDTDPAQVYRTLEALYHDLTQDVAEHGGRLAQHSEKRDNGLEQHAVMLGLLAKYAIAYAGDEGRDAFVAGVKRLGEERGTRMAARAILRGDRLDFINSQAYGEWRAAPGEMEFATFSTPATAVSLSPKCAWNDYWRKHGLLEYGKYFCTCIDASVIRGFNSSFDCEVISNLTWGADSCKFDWKVKLTPEEEAQIERKKAELGKSCVREFNYHIGHVVHSVGGEIIYLLGADGKDAVDAAVFEFTCIFGREYVAAFENIYPGDML